MKHGHRTRTLKRRITSTNHAPPPQRVLAREKPTLRTQIKERFLSAERREPQRGAAAVTRENLKRRITENDRARGTRVLQGVPFPKRVPAQWRLRSALDRTEIATSFDDTRRISTMASRVAQKVE